MPKSFIPEFEIWFFFVETSSILRLLAYRNDWKGFSGSSVIKKKSICSAGDLGCIPGLVRSPGEGNGNPLQYSCLENSRDREAWRATVHGVTHAK